MPYISINRPHHPHVVFFTSGMFWFSPTRHTKGSNWELQPTEEIWAADIVFMQDQGLRGATLPFPISVFSTCSQKLPEKTLVLTSNSRWVICQGLVAFTFTIPLKSGFMLPLVLVFHFPLSVLFLCLVVLLSKFMMPRNMDGHPLGSFPVFPVHFISLLNVTFFSFYFYGRLRPPHWSPNTADSVEIWTQALWTASISLMVQTKCPDLAGIQNSKQEHRSHKASACIALQGGERAVLLPRTCSHIQS